MNNFFCFETPDTNIWTVINIDKIIAIEHQIISITHDVETETYVYVGFGKDVKKYKLNEDQFNKLNKLIKPIDINNYSV